MTGPASSHPRRRSWKRPGNYSVFLRDSVTSTPAWTAATEYGELDITINLPKPEKDPREIARARTAALSSYP